MGSKRRQLHAKRFIFWIPVAPLSRPIYGSAASGALGQVLIPKQMGSPMAHQNIIPDRLTIGGCIYIASAAPWFFILAGLWVAIGMLALAVLIVAACRLPALALVTVGRPVLGVGNHFSSAARVAQLRSRDVGQ
jgi:uncharacterized membrane protein